MPAAPIARDLAGETTWRLVNDGEGVRWDALLLVTPGTPIALIPVGAVDTAKNYQQAGAFYLTPADSAYLSELRAAGVADSAR